MKREAVNHTKMKRLCRRLDLPVWQAVGLLESIWKLTESETPRGDIGRLSNEDIALAIDYRGNEDEMIEALVASEWLERDEEHRLIVHDWPDHCPDMVHIRLARTKQHFVRTVAPRLSRLGGKEREECAQFYASCAQTAQSVRTLCAPPIPIPIPIPEPIPVLPDTRAREALVEDVVPDISDTVERIYRRHPKKRNRGLAFQYLAQAVAGGAQISDIERVHALWCATETWQWKSGAGAPELSQWVLDEGWKYPPPDIEQQSQSYTPPKEPDWLRTPN